MNDKSVKEYLAAVESAKNAGDRQKAAKLLEKIRLDAFNADNEVAKKDVAAKAPAMNPFFEELGCVGFNPQERRLEAIVRIKQKQFPGSYGGGAGTVGSYEYVGFYVDWNNDGDFVDIPGENVCPSYVHVYDPPGIMPPNTSLPICYAVYRDITPPPNLTVSKVVKVRAVLQWNQMPTSPNGGGLWGHILEATIRIDPIK